MTCTIQFVRLAHPNSLTCVDWKENLTSTQQLNECVNYVSLNVKMWIARRFHARSYCRCRYDYSSSIRSYVIRMHHHVVEARSAKERERRRQWWWAFVTIHAMMMRNKLDSNTTESTKIERVFWSFIYHTFRSDHFHESSLADVQRMVCSGWFWHTCWSMVTTSTFMHPFFTMCPPIGWFVIEVEFYGLQHVCFGVNQNGIV